MSLLTDIILKQVKIEVVDFVTDRISPTSELLTTNLLLTYYSNHGKSTSISSVKYIY